MSRVAAKATILIFALGFDGSERKRLKQVPAAFSFGKLPPSEIVNLTNTPDRHEASLTAEPAPKTNSSPISSVRRQLGREAISRPPEIGLWLRLVMVCNAWDDFQECRKRDAVYGYLRAVFAIVVDCKGRRRTKRLLRRAFQFAGLPLDKNADPFAAVIRCTSERNIDNKTISKWARALRYAAQRKKPRMPLKTFVKKMGGINACAERYAIYLGRGRQ